MQLKRKIVDCDIKAKDGGEFGSLEGYASCTKNLDGHGDIIAPGAFAQDLSFFLANGFVGGLNHDWNKPIGKPKAATEDGRGLFCSADLIDVEHARECRAYMKADICKKLSIGYQVLGRIWLETQDDVKSWWQQNGYAPSEEEVERAKYGARVLTRVKLYEFSPVIIPANDSCDITGSKGDGPHGGQSLDDHFLATLGTVEEFAARLEGYKALKAGDGKPVPPERVAQFARLFDRMAALKGGLAEKAIGPDLAIHAQALALEVEMLDLAL